MRGGCPRWNPWTHGDVNPTINLLLPLRVFLCPAPTCLFQNIPWLRPSSYGLDQTSATRLDLRSTVGAKYGADKGSIDERLSVPQLEERLNVDQIFIIPVSQHTEVQAILFESRRGEGEITLRGRDSWSSFKEGCSHSSNRSGLRRGFEGILHAIGSVSRRLALLNRNAVAAYHFPLLLELKRTNGTDLYGIRYENTHGELSLKSDHGVRVYAKCKSSFPSVVARRSDIGWSWQWLREQVISTFPRRKPLQMRDTAIQTIANSEFQYEFHKRRLSANTKILRGNALLSVDVRTNPLTVNHCVQVPFGNNEWLYFKGLESAGLRLDYLDFRIGKNGLRFSVQQPNSAVVATFGKRIAFQKAWSTAVKSAQLSWEFVLDLVPVELRCTAESSADWGEITLQVKLGRHQSLSLSADQVLGKVGRVSMVGGGHVFQNELGKSALLSGRLRCRLEF